jgi:hypothetical protein
MTAEQAITVCTLNAYEEEFQYDADANRVYGVCIPFLYLVSSFINDGDADEWNVHRTIDVTGRISWFAIDAIPAGAQLLTSYGHDRARFNLPALSPQQMRRNLARAAGLHARGVRM